MEWNRQAGRCQGLAVAAVLCLGLGCQGLLPGPWPFGSGAVEGRVLGEAAEEGAWTVVYLDGSRGRGSRGATPAFLRSGTHAFSPPLLVVTPRQKVEIANGDAIHHRFFSTSRPNDFELPVLAGGKSHWLAFEQVGVVRVYCSLHPAESGTIFVAPTSHFATVRAPGRYAIEDVPPGRYVLHAWSEGGGAPIREITIRNGRSAFVEVALGEAQP